MERRVQINGLFPNKKAADANGGGRPQKRRGLKAFARAKKARTAIFAFFCAALLCLSAAAQELSFQNKIRLALWAELDAYPGLIERGSKDGGQEKPRVNQGIFDHAISQMKRISPLLLNGMVYGWEFDYTPSDRLRGVDEYFEVHEIRSFDQDAKRIVYESPWFDQSKVHCWVNFERSEAEIQSYRQWSAVQNPRIMGLGGGKISKGFDGLEDAARNALKDAVRSYYRKILRNKPKQITGRVLINKIPAILIKSGEYQMQLDFFLETGIIKEYQNF